MKTILVTGGRGHIGSNLCEKLIKSGYKVYSIDNNFNSTPKVVPGVIYIDCCISEIFLNVDFNVDVVFHLGEYSRVESSFDDIEYVHDFNIKGTFEVIKFCSQKNVKLVYAGSSTKFGDGGANSNASPYAWSKSRNIELIKNYSKWFDLNYCIVYFYNSYGKEFYTTKYKTLITIYKEKFLSGEPMPVVLPGTQLRNFTHIDDIISALLLVGEFGSGDGYGIGSDKSYTVLEVANMFSDNIEFLAERKGNRLTSSLETEKTKALGWSPKENLTDYISNFKEINQ